MPCERKLCPPGRKVSYKSRSGIIRAESRRFCSLGQESSELGARAGWIILHLEPGTCPAAEQAGGGQ